MLSGGATNTNFAVFGLTRSVYNSESTDLEVILPLFTVCLDVRMVSLLQSTYSSATTQIEI
jgi:hypothetical protein